MLYICINFISMDSKNVIHNVLQIKSITNHTTDKPNSMPDFLRTVNSLWHPMKRWLQIDI